MRRPHTDNSTAAWGCSRRVMSHRSVVISGFRPYRNQFPPTIWSENDFGWMVIQLGRLNIWFTSNTVSTSEIKTPERTVTQDTEYCTHHLSQATAVDAAIRCIYMWFVCISVFLHFRVIAATLGGIQWRKSHLTGYVCKALMYLIMNLSLTGLLYT